MANACVMDTIAQKYAKAFFNVYGSAFDNASIEQVNAFSYYLLKNNEIFVYFNLLSISQKVKMEMIGTLCDRFNLNPSIKNLIEVLLRRRRIDLFCKVLCLFVMLFRKHHNIVACTITSSDDLDKKDKIFIKDAISNILGTTIIAEFVVDNKLISGIKVQSETNIWECSIAKRLKMLENDVLQRVQLW